MSDFTCVNCKKEFPDHRKLGGHMSRCSVSATQPRKKKKTSSKRPRSKIVQSTHSTTKHQRARKKSSKQTQSRAVSYSTTCSWNPISRKKVASLKVANDDAMFASDGCGDCFDIDDDEISVYAEALLETLNDVYEEDDDDNNDIIDHEEEDQWEDIDDEDDDDDCAFFDVESQQSSEKVYADEKWSAFLVGDGVCDGGSSEWSQSFKYKDNLPPYYIALSSLLHILSQHKGNDLKIFDRIVEWVGHFSDKYPDIWSTRSRYTNHTRKSLLPFLAGFFDTKHLFPEPTNVKCSHNKLVTVPTFDFERQLLSVLNNKDIMKDSNLLEENFDKETLRPTKTYSELGPDDVIDDIHTGYLYHQGVEMYCSEEPPPGVDLIVPAPIIIFADEASTDKHGALSTEPVSWVLAFLNGTARMKYDNWRHLGYSPNTAVGHGRHFGNYDDEWVQGGKKRGKKKIKDTRTVLEKVADLHRVYRAILKSCIDCCQRGGVRAYYKGKRCIFKPFLLMVIGDAKGFNSMCCHFNSNGNSSVNCLVKDCQCSFPDLVSTKPQCVRITLADRKRALTDADFAKSISYHRIPSAFDEMPLADIIEGIVGITPFETLHVHGHGSYKDGPEAVYDIIGAGNTKAAEKESIDLLFQAVAYDVAHNSQRRLPRIAIRFGPTDGTRITGIERKGNYLVLLICLTTSRGKEIMDKFVREKNIPLSKIRMTMTLMLSFDAWCSSAKSKWELDNCEDAVSFLLESIIKYLPRAFKSKEPGAKEGGCNGYHKIKFHALWLFITYMRKFGGSCNFDSSCGEEHHRIAVNMAGEQTQRRPASFTYQTSLRDAERSLIHLVYSFIRHMCPEDKRHLYTYSTREMDKYKTGEVTDNVTLIGKYRMVCKAIHEDRARLMETRFSHSWCDKAKRMEALPLSQDLLHGLASYTQQDAISYDDEYFVDGYTEVRVPSLGGNTIYRALESYRGDKRYDWGLLVDPQNVSYIVQCCGFFQYTTPGFPTYKLVKMDGHTVKHIKDNQLRDDTLYVACRASTVSFTFDKLSKSIVTPFKLKSDDTVYIFPAACLKMSLCVVRDFGSRDSISYHNILPQNHWHLIFKSKIEYFMNK